MKILALVIVIGIIALVIGFYFGGVGGFDPAAQAEIIRQQVKRGMTWQQVVEVQEPRKFQTFSTNPNSRTGMHPEQDFDAQKLDQMIKDGKVPEGFVFPYILSNADAIEVTFDGKGEVVSVRDMPTVKDLFEGKVFTQ